MNKTTSSFLGITLAGVLALIVTSAHADIFGSGADTFTIDFVNIGNAGNSDDAGAGGGSFSSPYGGVGYDYRMGITEVAQDWITKATNLGMTNVTAGPWTASQPAGSMTWYEAARFVNWLNTSTGGTAAYKFDSGGNYQVWQSGDTGYDASNEFRNSLATYVLPSEDEWLKAAYHQNDGVTANYWDYATGSNTSPTSTTGGTSAGTTVFLANVGSPANVDNNGGLSSYGTRGQNGNMAEWLESALDGTNDSASETRLLRGGDSGNPDTIPQRSSSRFGANPTTDNNQWIGFRVASVVPEPSSALLLLGSGMMLLLRRRRAAAH